MSDTTKPRRPGPKPSGKALSNAERQRRYIARLRARAAVSNAVPDKPVTDELAAAHERIAHLERQAAMWRADAAEQARKLAALDERYRKAEAACARKTRRLERERDEARAELAAIKSIRVSDEV